MYYNNKLFSGRAISIDKDKVLVASFNYKDGLKEGESWYFDGAKDLIKLTYSDGRIIKWSFYDSEKELLLSIDTLKKSDDILNINIALFVETENNLVLNRKNFCNKDSLEIKIVLTMFKNEEQLFHDLEDWEVIRINFASPYFFKNNENMVVHADRWWILNNGIVSKEMISALCKGEPTWITLGDVIVKTNLNKTINLQGKEFKVYN